MLDESILLNGRVLVEVYQKISTLTYFVQDWRVCLCLCHLRLMIVQIKNPMLLGVKKTRGTSARILDIVPIYKCGEALACWWVVLDPKLQNRFVDPKNNGMDDFLPQLRNGQRDGRWNIFLCRSVLEFGRRFFVEMIVLCPLSFKQRSIVFGRQSQSTETLY